MPLRTAVLLAALVAALVAPLASIRADAPTAGMRELTSRMQENIDDARKECGAGLTLRSDIAERAGRAELGQCGLMFDAIISLCTTNTMREKWKPIIAREIKGVECMFQGHKPRNAKENIDVYVRRNMSVERGFLRIYIDGGMGNVKDNAMMVLMRALADKGAPVDKRNLATGDNGEKCSVWSECRTGLCAAGVCAPCDAKSACRSGTRCHTGVCRTPEGIRDAEAPTPDRSSPTQGASGKPAACKGRGAGVLKNDREECCSHNSKLVKGQRTCL